jgi:membrane protease YdiL (CAAX protease family)
MLVQHSAFEPLSVIGLARVIQIAGILAGIAYFQQGLSTIGWSPSTWRKGLKTGVLWASVIGFVVCVAMGIIFLAGINPVRLVRSPLPSEPGRKLLFFLVGGLIAPLAEEICFRGVLYSYFRRWGIILAILASTTIFVVLHSVQGIPVIQIVGGVLFAISYELSGSLMVPIVIHATGNLAIFTLSLPYFSFY